MEKDILVQIIGCDIIERNGIQYKNIVYEYSNVRYGAVVPYEYNEPQSGTMVMLSTITEHIVKLPPREYKDIESKRNIMIAKRNKYKDDFMKEQLKFCPKANKEVLGFIADFMYHGVPNIDLDDSAESIRSTFRAGYCWHFATMLMHTFGRGCICWAYPISHMVWMDTDGIPYDIEGVNYSDCEWYIPSEYIGESIGSFLHIPNGVEYPMKEPKEILDVFKKDIYSGKLASKGLLYVITSDEDTKPKNLLLGAIDNMV